MISINYYSIILLYITAKISEYILNIRHIVPRNNNILYYMQLIYFVCDIFILFYFVALSFPSLVSIYYRSL